MSHLVRSFDQNYVLADLVLEDVVHHPLGVHVGELDGESLESVTLRDIVFDTCLKLIIGESLSANSFKLVVGQSCLKHVAQLAVPVCLEVSTIILSNPSNFVSQQLFKNLFIFDYVALCRRHQVAHTVRWCQSTNLFLIHTFPTIVILKIP